MPPPPAAPFNRLTISNFIDIGNGKYIFLPYILLLLNYFILSQYHIKNEKNEYKYRKNFIKNTLKNLSTNQFSVIFFLYKGKS